MSRSIPKLRRQDSRTGRARAFVQLNGRRRYLGEWGARSTIEAYQRLLTEVGSGAQLQSPASDLTIIEMIDRWLDYATDAYSDSLEVANTRPALRPLVRLYGTTRAGEFGPKSLKTLRVAYVEEGIARRTVNGRIGRIRRIFKWAAAEELVPAGVHAALATVDGLRAGRTTARESTPKRPVNERTVQLTLPLMTPTTRAMVESLMVTGMRSSEVCCTTTGDLDMDGDVWRYRAPTHPK